MCEWAGIPDPGGSWQERKPECESGLRSKVCLTNRGIVIRSTPYTGNSSACIALCAEIESYTDRIMFVMNITKHRLSSCKVMQRLARQTSPSRVFPSLSHCSSPRKDGGESALDSRTLLRDLICCKRTLSTMMMMSRNGVRALLTGEHSGPACPITLCLFHESGWYDGMEVEAQGYVRESRTHDGFRGVWKGEH
ncbi:hypothetical protein K474DRAFT_148502 [Panus rudis PR-1116 ss-1]|nr:hypothetical protein K474DRAFT_148502 [Panus rudis PR-1116 ss-1]